MNHTTYIIKILYGGPPFWGTEHVIEASSERMAVAYAVRTDCEAHQYRHLQIQGIEISQ